MSRVALSKSRAEKTRLPAVPVPHVVVEIVPGRFTEADWAFMIAEEEGEEIIAELMDDLMTKVMDECYKVYLVRQLIPFTIAEARDALVQIIEWRFLVHDDGDTDISGHAIWQQDEEPQPCITDSWAQGSVPVIRTGLTARETNTKIFSEESYEDVLKKKDATEVKTMQGNPGSHQKAVQEDMMNVIDVSPVEIYQFKEECTKTEKSASLSGLQRAIHQPLPPPKDQKPKRTYKPHRGPLRSAGLKEITKSLEDTEKELLVQQLSQTVLMKKTPVDPDSLKLLPLSFHNLLKIQLGRPPQNKDVTFDEFGNITSVPKLDFCHLPRHYIKPHFEVVDVKVEAERQKLEEIQAGGPVLLRTGRSKNVILNKLAKNITMNSRMNFSELNRKPTNVSDWPLRKDQSKTLNQRSKTLNQRSSLSGSLTQTRSDSDTFKSGILIKSMHLAPGVVLREIHNTKDHLWHNLAEEDNNIIESWENLKPILTAVPRPAIMVEQLIKDHVPQVHPMNSFQSF
ncbi:uncharacterized protein C2orf81 homolog [Protopterus annectens]|uniref:uncharacterized protein C2orf81 homolog n=1 Tax=Protopterus annectens TaxID=7888 RepID=UPI001CFA18B3|nr:uncharacterized protein C2orf81 homolog [Protopterus annectens]